MKRHLNKIVIPLVILTAVISLAVTQSSFYRKIGDSQRLFNQVYNQIFSTYVDELDPDAFTKASIQGITQNLDPYTAYMVEDEQHVVNLLSKGNYGGVGIQLGYRNKTMSVVAPMDGGPAKKAGIMSGDVILSVDDEEVRKLSFNDAASKIRGEKGSKVKLTIKRFGDDEPIIFDLIRSIIKVKDVTYSGMLSPTTGYVRLNRFSRNTPTQMHTAFVSLLDQNASELIIDLRDNPGGLLSASVAILDMIVKKDKPLVSTKGRTKDSNRTFYSRRKPVIPADIKIAVLINQGSASASEIVAGAIQDLDRGIVIGQKSYGKGLVQTQFPIDAKRSIKITTARYYVPSGRFIQKRDYIDEKYILNKTEEDSIFTTLGGRKVLGNGGITPDSTIAPELMQSLSSQYWRRGYFYSFAQRSKHLYKTFTDVESDNTIMDKFHKYIDEQADDILLPGEKELETVTKKIAELDSTNAGINDALSLISDFYDDQEVKRGMLESDDIRQVILLEFAGLLNGPEGRLKQALKNDKIVQSALDILSDKLAYETSLIPSEVTEN
ncbi:MAG: S41 family peptidase [Candidatus Marinimicrobia bacterium]|jgi:carboxyl-terminal processing protease|nr:S41 family peptidase [Candidatus Neomarinimicrobiota bacterium]MBT3675804.1 S41 family peptidase [Candidatus Neomarinimicrobiota bacterium]MBT3762966.1 S41 family peptidase [Candidatus Neomarinimicrobiota bacterium]MBT4069113.1 S41 family peptidase [Candidatus Neomarinimicrobiota bacterium]MBT4271499.1 S41 family peptidase [Candidatus Neomarinimicrobiota bacterium]